MKFTSEDTEDSAMPLFGARMVCDAGNYRQVQERHRAELERETNLGK